MGSVQRSEVRAATSLAMSLSNTAKTLKTRLVGAFQMLADPLLTEHYARLGFGAVLIDQQHGLLDERTAFECVQRLEKFPSCFPIIRVCDNTTALISRALDAGACGIIAPMINTREDAQRLVELILPGCWELPRSLLIYVTNSYEEQAGIKNVLMVQ